MIGFERKIKLFYKKSKKKPYNILQIDTYASMLL